MNINTHYPPVVIIDDIYAPCRLQCERRDGIVCLSALEKSMEKCFRTVPARLLDRIGKRFFKRPTSELKVSSYYAWARKKVSEEVKIAR
jgi:hypothetical protein